MGGGSSRPVLGRPSPGRPVVVCTDDSPPAEQAVRWAARYAQRHRAPLTIVAVIPQPMGAGLPLLRSRKVVDALDSTAQSVVEEAAEAAAAVAPEVTITTQVAVGRVAATLLEFAETARMIVLGRRGSGGVFRRRSARGGAGEADDGSGKVVLGSVSLAVVQYAPCPVALVRGDWRRGERAHGDGWPVVVGVDGSEATVHALDAAFGEASLRGVSLVAAHSWSDVPMSVFALSDVRQWYDERTVAELVLAEQLAGYEADYPDVPVQRVVAVDRPQDMLIEWSSSAQQLVLGARGRGGVPGMRLGSTALKVLRAARCPVLIAR